MAQKQAISIPVAQTSEAATPSFVEIGIESSVGDRRVKTVAGQVGDPIDLQIGQMHTHRAVANVPILSVRWTVYGSTLKGYPMNVHAGAPVPLDAQDLTANPITFAWIEPGFFLVGAEITTPYGTQWVSHSFNVFAPQVLSYTAQVGATAVYDENQKTFLPAGPGNIWVPLAQIAWYWGGSSAFDNHTLQYGPATHTSGGAAQSEPPGALPRWTKNVRDGRYDPLLAANLAAHAARASAALRPAPELAALA